MRKVQAWLGSLLLLGFFPLVAKPVMAVTIPTTLLHLNPAASSTITFTVKNVSGITLPDLVIPIRQIANAIFSATVESTTCSGSLADQADCQVVLELAGRKDGQTTLSPEVCAFGGSVCSHGALQVIVNNVQQNPPITSLAATLPANVEVGVAYPIVATFQNPNSQYPMTGVAITKNPANCIKTADTCQGGVLAPLASCQVAYLFTPPTAGSYHLSGTFHYNEGPDIINQKTVLATQAALAGNVVTPLPANIEQDHRYLVAFQYTNFGTASLTYQTPVNPPAALTDITNTCTSGTLASHASCLVTGYYTAGSTGSKTLTMTVIPTGPGSLNPVPLSTTSTATNVAIIGTVSQPLPNTITPGINYPVVFTFTNPNLTLAAQNVEIDKLLPPTLFSQTADTCTDTLAPGASCAISGEVQAADEGPVALSVIFDHDDNAAVPLTTTSIATQATLVGTVVGFPANVETNVPQTVTFTFANHGSADATINNTTLAFPNSIGPRTNTCTNNLVLAPGQHCTITDTLQNATPGPLTWSATANYTGGFANNPLNVTQNTSTTVGDTVVTGSDTSSPPLPANVQFLTGHPFQFTFTNSVASHTAANNIHVLTATPHVTGFSNDCPATLAPGASCTVSGTFNSAYMGPYTLSATLQYAEGAPVAINANTTVHGTPFIYTTNTNGNHVRRCTIDPATGLMLNNSCVDAGATLMNAPDDIVLSNTHAYIDNILGSNDIVTCTLTSAGLLTGCVGTPGPAGDPRALTLNPPQTRIYVADVYAHTIYVCDIGSNGAPTNCQNANATTLDGPHGLAINANGSRIYVANLFNDTVTLCNVNATDGKFTTCQVVASNVGGNAVTINPAQTQLYTMDAGGSTIRVCPINNVDGTLGACSVVSTSFTSVNGVQFNKNGSRAYVPNPTTNVVSRCMVNSIDGTFNSCVNSGITGLNAPRRNALLNVA